MHVHVRLGSEHYALPVEDVLEVAGMGRLTPLPGAPPPFIGVRNLRGEVLPVVDLADLLGAPGAGPPAHLVVAQSGPLRAGLGVESVVGVVELPGEPGQAGSENLSGALVVDDRLIGIVDVPRALSGLTAAEAS